MKITCSACHASYNLPDEKVAGRRVKVRCKRCSEPIVVDGSSLASIPPPPDFEDEATRVMGSPASEAPMWTVNLSDTEQGDMTNEEIVAGWQAGVVTEDAYVWREGMDDWKPILDVPELVSLLSQAMPAEPEPPAPEPELPAAPAPASTTPEPPAAALGGPRVPAPPRAAVSPPRVGGDPFFTKPRPKREKPKQDAAEARNENSMLFSLEALKAAAQQSSSDRPPPASLRVDEDLLIMGGRQEPFNAPLIQIDAPVAPAPSPKAASRMPMAVQGVPDTFGEPKSGGKGWLVVVAAIVVLGVGGFFAYDAFIAPAAESAPPVATAPAPPPEATPVTTAEPEPPPSEATAAPSAESEDKGAESARKQQTQPAGPSGPDRSPTGSTGRDSESTGSKSPSTGSDGQGERESKGGPEEKSEETPAADAPPFNTDAARAALTAAASKAAACKTSDGPTGSGKVQVTFVNSGRVTSANVVSGPFEGTSVGGCVARTFRQARVPAFSGDAQVVAKSFQIP